MNCKSFVLCMVAIQFAAVTAGAATIFVPDDQPDIQAGIDAAVAGDEVVVRDGTYTGVGNVNISFDKEITVRSENGPSGCIIDCEDAARGFGYIGPGATGDAALDGFTIENAVAWAGAAVKVSGSALTIRNNVITDCLANETYGGGAGIWLDGGSTAVIVDNFITSCSTTGYGAAIYVDGDQGTDSTPLILGNEISLCSATGNYGGAPGIFLDWGNGTIIDGNYIHGNITSWTSFAGEGGAICYAYGYADSMPRIITNNMLIGNQAMTGGAIFAYGLSSLDLVENNTIAYNRAAGWGTGIMCHEASMNITNNIIWANMQTTSSNNITSQVCNYDYNYGKPVVMAFNDTQIYTIERIGQPAWDNFTEINNFDVDPAFVDPSGYWIADPSNNWFDVWSDTGDYHIAPVSPCIDAGTITSAAGDFDEEVRPQGAARDVGADEIIDEIYVTQNAMSPTECPYVLTECPICPTSCPVVDTVCAEAPTECPLEPTVCQVSDTVCPVQDTICPLQDTVCTGEITTCPQSGGYTFCVVRETVCPPVGTECPDNTTICPAIPTQC